MIQPRRSALFLPASNGRAIEKARGLPADVVILDLEDAVAPEAKDAARTQAIEAVRAGGFRARELVVRVNGIDGPCGMEDLAALRHCPPAAILLPKVSSPTEVANAAAVLGTGTPLWAMIETTRAILHIDAIAAAPALCCLVLGPNDLAKEMRCRPGADRLPLHTAMALLVTAARTHGRAALDGVNNDLSGGDAFAAECAQGRAFGFDGKTLIHPNQVEPANAAFSPSAEEVAAARAIVAAFRAPEAAGRGAIKVDGRMVERLHLEDAERTIALAEAE